MNPVDAADTTGGRDELERVAVHRRLAGAALPDQAEHLPAHNFKRTTRSTLPPVREVFGRLIIIDPGHSWSGLNGAWGALVGEAAAEVCGDGR